MLTCIADTNVQFISDSNQQEVEDGGNHGESGICFEVTVAHNLSFIHSFFTYSLHIY